MSTEGNAEVPPVVEQPQQHQQYEQPAVAVVVQQQPVVQEVPQQQEVIQQSAQQEPPQQPIVEGTVAQPEVQEGHAPAAASVAAPTVEPAGTVPAVHHDPNVVVEPAPSAEPTGTTVAHHDVVMAETAASAPVAPTGEDVIQQAIDAQAAQQGHQHQQPQVHQDSAHDHNNAASGNVVVVVESAAGGTPAAAASANLVETENGILEPGVNDVLNGRGASVNAHRGNQQFRALCFQRKPEFDAGNHAVKRRIATEIVEITLALPGRFLKKKSRTNATAEDGTQAPQDNLWYEISKEKSILKACQVMRDFQRPDRMALREMAAASGNLRKRQRANAEPSTPGVDTTAPAVQLDPIVENPFGVHDHDVLSGRGAFVNGHVGNTRFRKLALERKARFDAGNYSEKRALASDIVQIIRQLDPPGRFLKRVVGEVEKPTKSEAGWVMPPRGVDGSWEELNDDKAIHKACQVMRDIDRPDRGPDRNSAKKAKTGQVSVDMAPQVTPEEAQAAVVAATNAAVVGNAELAAGAVLAAADAVEDAAAVAAANQADVAVAATEAALDKALDSVQTTTAPAATTAVEVTTEQPVKSEEAGATVQI